MDFQNLIALKKQKRVGYFLFFYSRNCLMKTKGSHITHNVEALAKGRNRSTKVSALHRCSIGLQMLNFSRLPTFCQCNVMGSTVLKNKKKWN